MLYAFIIIYAWVDERWKMKDEDEIEHNTSLAEETSERV